MTHTMGLQDLRASMSFLHVHLVGVLAVLATPLTLKPATDTLVGFAMGQDI